MEDNLEIAFQSWATDAPSPKKISLDIPGWGGINKQYNSAQPWQCKPFVDANTAGIEVCWPLNCEIVIESEDGVKANIKDTWSTITNNNSSVSQFADSHVGINSNYRFKFPKGWSGMILPHPKWFDDPYSSNMPFIIPGMLEFDWWPKFFFVVVKVPPPGKKFIIKPYEPFFQIIPFKRHKVSVRKVSQKEADEMANRDALIAANYTKISTNNWKTKDGKAFGNIYKVLAAEIKKHGEIDWEKIKNNVAPKD